MQLPSTSDPARLRVWLVHDWLTGLRGGEKVLLQLTRLFPHARIATLFHLPGTTHPDLDARVAQTSFLQKIPHINRHYRNLLPLMPTAIKSMTLDAPCDLIISTSHCVAKGITVPPHVPHLCYCFTPMRYLWDLQDDYLPPLPSLSLKTALVRLLTPPLRDIDLALNESVTAFATTSHYIADRIQRCYHRPATVIPPGIDDSFYTLPAPAESTPASPFQNSAFSIQQSSPTSPVHRSSFIVHRFPPASPLQNSAFSIQHSPPFYLIVSALVPYKRLDLAIRAFLPPLTTDHWPLTTVPSPLTTALVIIGQGPEEPHLRQLAASAPHIHFLGWQSDDVIRWHYQHCRALLFPGTEDFGLVPLEAQACGAPIIAYAAGGALETIIPLLPSTIENRKSKIENPPAPPSPMENGKWQMGNQPPPAPSPIENRKSKIENPPAPPPPMENGKWKMENPSPTGLFFHEPTPASLRAAITRFEENRFAFTPEASRTNALRFTWPNFNRQLLAWISQILQHG